MKKETTLKHYIIYLNKSLKFHSYYYLLTLNLNIVRQTEYFYDPRYIFNFCHNRKIFQLYEYNLQINYQFQLWIIIYIIYIEYSIKRKNKNKFF